MLGHDVTKCRLDSYVRKVGEWVLIEHGAEEINNDRVGVVGNACPVKLALRHLLPGGSCSFEVAARNNVGRSDWSSTTETIETKKLKHFPSNKDNDTQGRKLSGAKGAHARSNANVKNNNMIITHGIGRN